jgi:uncharacterized integral membrane protein
MREIRVVLLFVGLGGLAIFAVQNWSQSLPLVFLGMQSLVLPLSVWVLAAVLAGAVTAWLIGGLFSLSTSTPAPSTRRSNNIPPENPREPLRRAAYDPVTMAQADTILQDNVDVGTSTNYRESFRSSRIDPVRRHSDEFEEEVDRSPDIDEDEFYEDWEEEEPARGSQLEVEVRQTRIEHIDYEVPQQPKESSWSGSVYSYTYREQQDSGAGRTDYIRDEPEVEATERTEEIREDVEVGRPEPVYDADYRIIQPPVPPTPPASEPQSRQPQKKSDNDWEWGEEKGQNLNEW